MVDQLVKVLQASDAFGLCFGLSCGFQLWVTSSTVVQANAFLADSVNWSLGQSAFILDFMSEVARGAICGAIGAD
jgi:hypothetical protein